MNDMIKMIQDWVDGKLDSEPIMERKGNNKDGVQFKTTSSDGKPKLNVIYDKKRGRPRLGPKKKSTEYFQHSNSDERIPRSQKTVKSSRNDRKGELT